MLTLEDWMDIKTLHQQGHSLRAIAELTGHSRNTVRKLLRQKRPQPFQKPQRASQLDPFKPYLEQRYRECALSSVRLHEEIKPMGYGGSLDVVQRYVKTLKPARAARLKLTVRFETPPGQQAQADWAYCGRFPDQSGQVISIYGFVMVLGFSRLRFVEFTTAMNLEHLLRCQMNAFAFFEGIPQTVLFDNMKQVKLDSATWNPRLLDFAGHYGYVPQTHAVRRPRTKGKVERLVGFVKDNFLNGHSFADLDDLNAQARVWLHSVNALPHATTGQPPAELWRAQEQAVLTPLGAVAPYQLCRQVTRKVDWEGLVRFARSRYSVPPQHAGQQVVVELRGQQIVIRCGDLVIAEHSVAARPDSCLVQEEHLQALWHQTVRRAAVEPDGAPPHWQLRLVSEVAQVELSHYQRLAESPAVSPAAASLVKPVKEAA